MLYRGWYTYPLLINVNSVWYNFVIVYITDQISIYKYWVKRMIESEKQQNVVAVCTPTGGFFDFLHTPVSNDRPPLLFVWQEATGSPNCLSGIEFPPHRTISILQGVLLVLSPNYHTVAIWLLNNCYYACRFKWEKYGTEHDYEWTNVVLNIIYSILARGTFKSTDILT